MRRLTVSFPPFQNHPRVRLHERGLQAVPARGLLEHDPVARGHPQGDAQPGHLLRQQRERGKWAINITELFWNNFIFIFRSFLNIYSKFSLFLVYIASLVQICFLFLFYILKFSIEKQLGRTILVPIR